TGIVAGLAVALLGGSRFQIAGPTGAFVPVLFSIVAQHGYGGLALAAMMAGVMLIAVGALKMGRLLKFFPYPVVAGFTSGIAVIATALLAHFAGWPVATIGSRFGELPSGWPGWHFPAISLDSMRQLMAPAFTIAALGAIESLLSAMVADGMAETRHDPNQELIGQGIANIFSPLVGGIAATGAIARTAANIRNGARTPVAAIIHSLVLLTVALLAAPIVAFI